MSYEELVDMARRGILERDFATARAYLEHAIDQDDRRPEAFNLLGVVEAIRGERGEAMARWRVALALAPNYEPALTNLRYATRRPRVYGALALG